ncbi:hypothetical protein FRAHR75_1610011 [Frankia sp. Hr75.2]|nr:hypothetical protein FRAHR75_1610011 [Frankia sp. Hr75.2]
MAVLSGCALERLVEMRRPHRSLAPVADAAELFDPLGRRSVSAATEAVSEPSGARADGSESCDVTPPVSGPGALAAQGAVSASVGWRREARVAG